MPRISLPRLLSSLSVSLVFHFKFMTAITSEIPECTCFVQEGCSFVCSCWNSEDVVTNKIIHLSNMSCHLDYVNHISCTEFISLLMPKSISCMDDWLAYLNYWVLYITVTTHHQILYYIGEI